MTLTSVDTFTTTDCRCLSLRRAGRADHEPIAALLSDLELPSDGVAEWLDQFWVAEHAGRLVGVAGWERYGEAGLLRSVGVLREWRGSGVGRTLINRVLSEARAAGVRDIYLLTITAEHYFPHLGFACIDRATVPDAVRASAEFTGACPASAVVMRAVSSTGELRA